MVETEMKGMLDMRQLDEMLTPDLETGEHRATMTFPAKQQSAVGNRRCLRPMFIRRSALLL